MKVTKDNAVVGLKVVIDKDSEYIEQQREAVYGVIVNSAAHFPAESDYAWVQVNWIAENGKAITCNSYRIGYSNIFDLNVYQEESKDVIPEYVECIKGYNTDLSINDFNVVGKIYEVESYNPKTEVLKLKGFSGSIAAIKFDGNSKGLSTDYKISTKAEFDLQNQLEVEENLVGRFIRANNQINVLNKGDYDLITSTDGDYFICEKSLTWNKKRIGTEFELMPIGFTPESQNTNTMELTENWCIKLTSDVTRIVKPWFISKDASLSINAFTTGYYYGLANGVYRGYSDKSTFWSNAKELTLDEFKRLVLKEGAVENPLITEAKRRYPVGSKAQCLVTKDFYPITEDVVFKEQEGKIFSYTNYGKSLYHKHYDGSTWSKQSSEEFKVGDWVTILRGTRNWCSGMDRYVGKTVQITEYKTIHLDYNNVIRFKDDGSWTWETTNKHYRKATPEEIAKAQGYKFKEIIGDIEVPYTVDLPDKHLKYPIVPKECYTKLPIVTSVKRSNIVPLKLEKQKSLINLPTI